MKWQRSTYKDRMGRVHEHGACVVSDDGAYAINRAPAPDFMRPGATITYMLAHNGRILHVERDVANTHDDALVATRKLKGIAAAHAAGESK